MAYDDSVNKHLIPLIPLATTTAGVLRAMDIGAASADHGEMLCIKRCKVKRLGFIMTEEVAGGTTAAPTVVFTRRPTPLSATGEAVVGTLTIPDATAVGSGIYKDVTPVTLEVGDTLEISHTVGVGTPTGIGQWYVEIDEEPEDVRNESDLSESA
jgi:hypothetical protein